jgi:hypothetical protein
MEKKANPIALGLYPIKDLPRGEYVRLVDVCKPCRGKGRHHDAPCSDCSGLGYTKDYPGVYIKGDYCRRFPRDGKYELASFNNINSARYQSGSVLVLAGITF